MRGLRAARYLQRGLLQVEGVQGSNVVAGSGGVSCLLAAPASSRPTSSSTSSQRHQQGQQRDAGSSGGQQQVAAAAAPWPTACRALHCEPFRQQSAAMSQASHQQQEQEQQQPAESSALAAGVQAHAAAAAGVADASAGAAAAAAAAATTLSGLAAKLTSGDPFLTSIDTAEGPIAAYKEGRLKGMYRKDTRQELTIARIQQVYDELKARVGRDYSLRKGQGLTLIDASAAGSSSGGGSGGGSWFSGWFGGGGGGTREESTAAGSTAGLQGLYMYGGVGVGKTMLMDLLVQESPPYFQLERTHFHDFMIEVHTRLRHFSSKSDPLTHVADEIADQTRVLCLDEFFVADVADAMILHRLFGRLWDRGLVLVSTSNRHPDALYEGGLQRNLFMPFIHRLKDQCAVHDMNSRTDYRKLAHHHRGLYFVTPTREEDLYERFLELTNGRPVGPEYVDVAMGRKLKLPRTGGCVTLFTFDELCNRPLGAADYIALANAKHTLAVSGVPVFTAANRQAAYRFVTLVDVLYEHRTRFLCSAEAMPFELFENIRTNQEARDSRAAAATLAAASGSDGSTTGSGAGSRNGSGGSSSGGSMDYASSGYSSSNGNGSEVVDDNLGFSKDRTISRLTEMQSEEYLRAHAKAHAPELLLALQEGGKQGAAAGSRR